MLAGPWNVADKLKIATTANWSYRLELSSSNRDFYTKPYEAANEAGLLEHTVQGKSPG